MRRERANNAVVALTRLLQSFLPLFRRRGTSTSSLTPNSFPQQQSLSPGKQKKIDLSVFYFPFDDLFTVYYSSSAAALVCMLGTPRGRSWIIHLFIPTPVCYSLFLSFCRANARPPVAALCVNVLSVSLPRSLSLSLHYYSPSARQFSSGGMMWMARGEWQQLKTIIRSGTSWE